MVMLVLCGKQSLNECIGNDDLDLCLKCASVISDYNSNHNYQPIHQPIYPTIYQTNSAYWIGPYDVRIPNHLQSCVASDGYNSQNKNGGVTEKFMINAPVMNQIIYRQKYAELRNDGNYYYKEKPTNIIKPISTININQKYEKMFDANEGQYGISFKLQKHPDVKTLETHWVGPYGILVPKTINSVPSKDGNELHQDGIQIQNYVKSFDIITDKDGNVQYEEVKYNLSELEYKNKYAIYRDGLYYWNEDK